VYATRLNFYVQCSSLGRAVGRVKTECLYAASYCDLTGVVHQCFLVLSIVLVIVLMHFRYSFDIFCVNVVRLMTTL